MDKPVVAQTSPYFVDVAEGRTYNWCGCKATKRPPVCDGAHDTIGP